MKIVIDLPEYLYDRLHDIVYDDYALDDYELAIFNGRPLPKGHGRLGDLDALEKEIENYSKGAFAMTPEFLVKDAPTIIEADTESGK